MLKLVRLRRSAVLTGFALIGLGLLTILGGVNSAQVAEGCQPDNLRTVNWSTDFCQSIVDFDEILVGNPTKDGIPSVEGPVMETVAEAAEWLVDQSPVIALEIDGEARAYPLAILMWHEIANDEIAGVPVAVTFCPLCNSAITFDRRLDEDVLDFGVSGFLRNSDLIMFDRQTESWWQQLTGEGLIGEFAGQLLEILPSQVIGFGSFVERYPEGNVMSRETGYSRQYGVNPYSGYDSRTGSPFLFRGELDVRLPLPVAHVLAAVVDDVAKAYPFSTLRKHGVINDSIGETAIVAFYQGGVASAMGDRVIDTARDIGTAGMYRATVDGEVLHFSGNDDGTFSDDETGSTWNAFGEAIDGALAGTQLEWINAFPHFWFAWAAFHPETEVFALP